MSRLIAFLVVSIAILLLMVLCAVGLLIALAWDALKILQAANAGIWYLRRELGHSLGHMLAPNETLEESHLRHVCRQAHETKEEIAGLRRSVEALREDRVWQAAFAFRERIDAAPDDEETGG